MIRFFDLHSYCFETPVDGLAAAALVADEIPIVGVAVPVRFHGVVEPVPGDASHEEPRQVAGDAFAVALYQVFELEAVVDGRCCVAIRDDQPIPVVDLHVTVNLIGVV